MKPTKIFCLLSIATTSAAALAADGSTAFTKPLTLDDQLVVKYEKVAAQVPNPMGIFNLPKVGIRVGGGTWNSFSLDGGIDVTYKVPFIPLPALRLDGEAWSHASNLGNGDHGNAVSLLAIDTFLVGYAGVGPSFYFDDVNGDHKSGFGAKILGGVNLPAGLYVEVGAIIGVSPTPAFATIGIRF